MSVNERLSPGDDGSISDPTIWRARGTPLVPPLGSGVLDGQSVAVKDLYAVAGFATGGGNPAWLAQAQPERADAWAVRELRAAGAAIAGIARTDDFAFSMSGDNPHYGTPPNPAAPGLVTGGSSSGPASAVATGQATIGLGTDTGGSVRVPASVCGLFGLRPTHGAIPDEGVMPLAPSFDTVGWLTADAVLLATVGSVLLPPSANRDPPRQLLALDPRSELVRRLADAMGLPLAASPFPGPDDLDALLAAFRAVQAAQAWQLRGQWITANPGALATDVEARFRFGASVDADARKRAEAMISGYRARMLDVIGPGTWLAQPAAGGPGHVRGATPAQRDAWRQATLRVTVLASAFGLPSCAIPAAARPPVGVTLTGPPGADHALLAAAVAVASARPAGI